MRSLLTLLPALLLAFTAFGAPARLPTPVPIPSPTVPMDLYKSAQYPFAIKYPAQWTEASGPGVTAKFQHGPDTGITIDERDLAGQGLERPTLKRYVDMTITFLSSSVENFQLISREPLVTRHGMPAQVVRFTGHDGLVTWSRFIYVREGGIAFNATYSAPTTAYRQLKPLIDFSFYSFQLWDSSVSGTTTIEETLDEIAEKVIKLRGLVPKTEVDRTFMTRTELVSFLRDDLDQARERSEQLQILLMTLGLIPEDADLDQPVLEFDSERIAGLYDPDAMRLYVIGDIEQIGPNEEVTFVHEYVHALQQQHFDLRALGESVQNSEERDALKALVEGDASLVTSKYITQFMSARMDEDAIGENQTPNVDIPPHPITRFFNFPYVEGREFVLSVTTRGGFDAVDRVYSRPPVSTEQILHPEKYFDNEVPVPVSLPDVAGALGTEWSEVSRHMLGEFFLRTYLETGVEIGVAADAAEGWGGDAFILFQGPGDQRLLVLSTVWDTEADAREFYDVAIAPLDNARSKVFRDIQGNSVLMIVAPSESMIEAVRAEIPTLAASGQ